MKTYNTHTLGKGHYVEMFIYGRLCDEDHLWHMNHGEILCKINLDDNAYCLHFGSRNHILSRILRVAIAHSVADSQIKTLHFCRRS